MDKRRRALLASYNAKKIENILVLEFFQSENDYIDGVMVGLVYYYDVYPTFPIKSDITFKDAKYPDDPRFTYVYEASYPYRYTHQFSQMLTSPDDVIISPQEDDTYIYKVEIRN